MASKYKFKGLPLDIYCKKHGLNMDTQRSRIAKKKKERPDLDEQTVVNMVMSTCGTNIKYIYKDQLLSEWCRENQEDYTKMVSRVEELKKQYPTTSVKEIVRMAIEDFNDRGIKYFYDDIPLVDYCRTHPEININSVMGHLRRTLLKNPNSDPNLVIKEYIESEHQEHHVHIVDGIPLKDYCEENEINYKTILSALCDYRKDERYKDLSEEERLSIILENYTKFSLQFVYQGMSLYRYCLDNNHSYSSIYRITKQKMEEDQTISMDDAITWAINNVKKYGILYYYENIPLVDYCKSKELNAHSVQGVIRKEIKRNLQNKPLDEVVAISVKKYESRNLRKKIRESILALQTNADEKEATQILNFLDINSDNVRDLVSLGFSYYQAAMLIYYFYDLDMGGGLKTLSLLKLRDIFTCLEQIKTITDEDEVFNFDIYVLYALYKCNLYDTRYLIYLRQRKFFISRIISVCNLYDIQYDAYLIEEFESELKVSFLEAIEKVDINIAGAFFNYMKKFIEGSCKTLALKVKQRKLITSLDEPLKIHGNDSSKNRIEFISAVNEDYNRFDDSTLSALSVLEPEEVTFIIQRYQNNYSLEELALYYNIAISELEQKEAEILNKLKNNIDMEHFI